MDLPRDVARCPGRPGANVPDECFRCARRSQAVADYIGGVQGLVWMEPIAEMPCSERLVTKQEAKRA